MVETGKFVALYFGAIAIVLFGTGSLITRFSIGPLAISAYLTIAITVFLSAAVFLQFFFHKFQAPSWQQVFRSYRFWKSVSVLCAFLAWSLFSRIFSASVPGAQNVMKMATFVLGIIFVALIFPRASLGHFWNAIAYATVAHSLFSLASNLFGWQIIDNRAFAMTAVVGLAAMVPLRPSNIILRLAPYVVFISILVSASRTTIFADFCIVGLAVLRDAKPVNLAVIQSAVTYVLALALTVLTYVFYAPTNAGWRLEIKGFFYQTLAPTSSLTRWRKLSLNRADLLIRLPEFQAQ